VVISVVVVTYHNLAEMGVCLDALAASLQPFESQLFIIDNASNDGTPQWLRSSHTHLKTRFDEVHLLFNPVNAGFTAAVNQGLRQCSGDLILLLNPDVIVQADTLTTLADALHAQPEAGVVAPQLRYPGGAIQPSCRRFPRKRDVLWEVSGLALLGARLHRSDWKMSDFDHRHSRFVDQPQGAFLLMRRQVLQRVGLLDDSYFMFFSDVDWCERVHVAGWKIWFCARTFVYHHKGASVTRRKPGMLVTSHRSFADYFASRDRTALEKLGTKIVKFILIMALWPRLLLTRQTCDRVSGPSQAGSANLGTGQSTVGLGTLKIRV